MNNLREYVEYLRNTYPQLFRGLITELPMPPHPIDYQIGEGYQKDEKYTEHRHRDVRVIDPEYYISIGRMYVEKVLRGIEEKGIEAIAWYAPFHVYKKWGIYVDIFKLLGLAMYISSRAPVHIEDSFYFCCRAVLQHEYFHFLTEYVATIEETITGSQVYLPYLRRHNPYNPDEEAMANALMMMYFDEPLWRMSKEFVKNAMAHICSMSPRGYRDYHQYLDRHGRLDAYKVREFWSREFQTKIPSPAFPTPYEMPGRHLLKTIPKYRYPFQEFPTIETCLFPWHRIKV